jgi:hypothetical protein
VLRAFNLATNSLNVFSLSAAAKRVEGAIGGEGKRSGGAVKREMREGMTDEWQ